MIRGFIRIKTYKAFLIGIKRDLAPFFGYKEIGVLIYDREKDKLFTQQFDERMHMQDWSIRKIPGVKKGKMGKAIKKSIQTSM